MQLDEYLKALEECPDERLEERAGELWRITAELGIYDNFPILLAADYDEFIRDMTEPNVPNGLFSGQYRKADVSGPTHQHVEYVPGTVLVQVLRQIVDVGYTCDEPDLVHYKRQMNNFTMGVTLHPYQKNWIEGVHPLRVIARVAADIGGYAKRKGVALCLPESMGWDHRKDLSRIVYFDPEEPGAIAPHEHTR